MKTIISTTLLVFLSSMIYAQDFEFDPSTGAQKMTFGNDVMYMLQLINQPSTTIHPQLIMNSEEGLMASLKINNEESAELVLSNYESTGTNAIINEQGVTFSAKNEVIYAITKSNGFQAYDDNGNLSVQIRGDVAGDGRVSTNELEITGGSDFSENFDVEAHASMDIQPGMLVSIVGESGKLALSSSKRDKKVVGIISGANGIETGMIMGQKGSIADGDYPIALSGRTYVYANTENGAIEPGDFITTSSTPGYGMKVKKHKKAQGAIVGKAMTSLNCGSGYVLVLVNLQ